MVQGTTKLIAVLCSPQDAKYVLDRARSVAESGRSVPAWIDVPAEVQGSLIALTALCGYGASIYNNGLLAGDVFREAPHGVNDALCHSRRSVVMSGIGVRIFAAGDDFLRLTAIKLSSQNLGHETMVLPRLEDLVPFLSYVELGNLCISF